MKKNHYIYIVFLFTVFFFQFALLAEDEEAVEELHILTEAEREGYKLTKNRIPEGFPFVLSDKTGINLGKLMESEIRQTYFTLKNTSDKPAEILGMASGCPCITLLTTIRKQVVAPGGEVKVDFTVDAKHLNAMPFERDIYLYAKGFGRVKIGIVGDIRVMMEYKPKQVIDLGEFTGEYPFVRKIDIHSLFDEDIVNIGQVSESKNFKVQVEKVAPKHFRVTMTAKVPLKRGRMREIISLPVTGVKGYGPLEVGLMGIVADNKFSVSKKDIIIQSADVPKEEEYVASFDIVPFIAQDNGLFSRQKTDAKKVFFQPAKEDEDAQRPWNDIKTWEKFLKDFEVTGLLSEIKYELVAHADGIKVKLIFPAGYLNAGRYLLPAVVTYKGKMIGRVKLKVY
ncbi:MAG: DUF1573 domain-containing protein [Victivallales bacterium]|nr:DUF1573 domain-containing protein [Victivallales bacterium]